MYRQSASADLLGWRSKKQETASALRHEKTATVTQRSSKCICSSPQDEKWLFSKVSKQRDEEEDQKGESSGRERKKEEKEWRISGEEKIAQTTEDPGARREAEKDQTSSWVSPSPEIKHHSLSLFTRVLEDFFAFPFHACEMKKKSKNL